ncbi:MAG TPA: ABC transporter permease [Aggregatilineales bacterium]|nr:ABC transporter permease [Aggregatilineales bacterium]
MKERTSFFSVLGKIEGLPIAIVLLVLYGALILSAPTVFTQPLIYMSFLETVPKSLIVGLGLTLVITAGEIDLSFPAVIAFSGWALTWVYRGFANPILGASLGIVAALVVGGFIGWINGLMVARLRIPSIMATLASQFFWYGMTTLVANGLQVSMPEIASNPVHEIFVGQLGGMIPVQALWALALAIFLWFILNRHKFGEAISFIGDNANVARVMGINVEQTRIQLFTVQGIIAAFASVILTLDVGVFYPTQGNFLLPVMAAVFVGGTSIAGGYGSIVGTFIGSYVIGSLEAGVVATTISGYWIQVVEGIVMGAVITLNALIGEGFLAALSARLQHWGVPVRQAEKEALGTGDPALKTTRR